MKQFRLALLTILLLLLASCGSGGPSPSALVATPASTPTPAITPTPTLVIAPTPTISVVPSRTVHFLTSDHIQLAGLLYGHGKTVVICSHMLDTDKSIWSDSGIAQHLALQGYLVLTYDFRGNGDSEGRRDVLSLDVDLRAALAFAHQQGATKIVLLGASMGGTVTLEIAASTRVTAVITLSAPQDFGNGVSDAQVKAISAPKLFVNSQDDDYASDTTHMYEIASGPKELHLYPGSAHGTGIFDDPINGSNLTQLILNFLAHYASLS